MRSLGTGGLDSPIFNCFLVKNPEVVPKPSSDLLPLHLDVLSSSAQEQVGFLYFGGGSFLFVCCFSFVVLFLVLLFVVLWGRLCVGFFVCFLVFICSKSVVIVL